MHEQRGDGGVDAAGEGTDRVPVADRPRDLGHGLFDEGRGRPIAGAPRDVEDEASQERRAVRSVGNLGVELHPEPAAAVAHRRVGQALGTRAGVEAVRKALHRIAVAHPGRLGRGQAGKDAAPIGDLEQRRPVFALALRRDLAPGEGVGHEVHPVADPEHRQATVEDRRVDRRGAGVVDAHRAAGEDHALHAAVGERGRGDVMGNDLAVDPRLAHPPGDELGVLAPVVEDRDRLAVHR